MNSLDKKYLDFNKSEIIDLDKVTLDKINLIINEYIRKFTLEDIVEKTNEVLGTITVISELYDYLDEKDECDKYIYILMDKLRKQMTSGIYIHEISLYGGLAEVGLAVYILNKQTGNYGKFLDTINELIIDILPGTLNYLNYNINNLRMFDYDVVTGISGIIGYLLNFSNRPKILELIKESLDYLIKLTKNINVSEYEVPGWYISRDNQFRDDEKETFKNGNFNYGLSHGVAGILTALSLAFKQDIVINGQREAIEKIIKEYKDIKLLDNKRIPFWPGQYSFEDYIEHNPDSSTLGRKMSWCYGSIGILRALKLSAMALNDQILKKWVSEKVNIISKININEYNLGSPTLCHGYSGLMLLLLIEYKENPNIELQSRIKELLYKVLNSYDENSIYGFINIENYEISEKIVIEKTEDNSFLTGTSGVILAIISAIKYYTYFDRQLMIN
ncbi:MAG: lanthionine synthetase C family protein [Terrisporobacter sp.]|uniref:lanthionine synthetase C family protein n=1 Tax=Terrisporobacter sp. TaxID=1965305 RepID=UPI002FC9EEC3